MDGHILKTQLFENDDVTIITWFPCPSRFQTQIQNDRWLLCFKFLWRNMDGKYFMRFQSETSVFKFLQRSVDGALGNEYDWIHTDCIFLASRFMISSVFSSTCCWRSSLSRSNDLSVARISAVSKLCSAFLFSISSTTWKKYYDINHLGFIFLIQPVLPSEWVTAIRRWAGNGLWSCNAIASTIAGEANLKWCNCCARNCCRRRQRVHLWKFTHAWTHLI